MTILIQAKPGNKRQKHSANTGCFVILSPIGDRPSPIPISHFDYTRKDFFVAFGVYLKLTKIAHIAVPAHGLSLSFGAAMAVLGVGMAIFGSLRYAATDPALREDRVEALSALGAHVIALIVVLIGGIIAFELFGYR